MIGLSFHLSLFDVLQNLRVKIFQHILNWVEEQTYWIASRFLILGFELELYSPSQYCMVYWYVYVVLMKLAEKIHLKTLASDGTGKFSSVNSLVNNYESYGTRKIVCTFFPSGKRKGKKKRHTLKDVAKNYRIPPAVLFLQCQICLAEGLTMVTCYNFKSHDHGSGSVLSFNIKDGVCPLNLLSCICSSLPCFG